MEDGKIILLLWSREESALRVLEREFGKLLYSIAFNILGVRQDAQECVNDSYMAIWNTIPPQKPNPLRPYVCRVGRNIALTRLRNDSAQKRCSRYDLSLEELSEVLPDRSMEEVISARMLGQAIDRFLQGQSRENRTLFLRRYWFGDSVRQAAGCIGITANVASVRLSRMRTALKAYLEQEELL